MINIYNLNDLKRSSNAREDQIYIPFSQKTIDTALKRVAHFETDEIHGHTFLIYNRPLIYNNRVVGVLQAATYTGELWTTSNTCSFLPRLLRLFSPFRLGGLWRGRR